ncbi:unnamed protein product [Nippostrongylus brasiliensis]|uniref:Uncharacterized protein n=1 Tax=Nippostrongylus brasiliensis TaxID=27835 RepID=A0A0N4YAC3_NIPBR|nr:unnamed protein product [Nippostrongylus brasiliensis]
MDHRKTGDQKLTPGRELSHSRHAADAYTHHYTTEDIEVVPVDSNSSSHSLDIHVQFSNLPQQQLSESLTRAKTAANTDSRKESILHGRELNPGLAYDRRGYSPLYYRGAVNATLI